MPCTPSCRSVKPNQGSRPSSTFRPSSAVTFSPVRRTARCRDRERTSPSATSNAFGTWRRSSPTRSRTSHLAMDGTERAMTWAELDQRSSQVAGAFAGRGVAFGDLVGLGLRNSPELDDRHPRHLEAGRRSRARAMGRARLGARSAAAGGRRPSSTSTPTISAGSWRPDPIRCPSSRLLVSPHVNGICSSGSTGTPKVILLQTPAVYNPSSASRSRRGGA